MALLRFYLQGAARIALRNALVTLATLIVLLALAPDVTKHLRSLALALAAADAPRAPSILVVAIAGSIATSAGKTLRLGLRGWLASLPSSQGTHRRSIAAALLLPLAPLLAAVALSASLTVTVLEKSLSIPALLGSVMAIAAAAVSSIPVARGWLSRPIAIAAALVAASGSWIGVIGGVLLLLLWDLVSGEVQPLARPASREPVPSPAQRRRLEPPPGATRAVDSGDLDDSFDSMDSVDAVDLNGAVDSAGSADSPARTRRGPRLAALGFSLRIARRALGIRAFSSLPLTGLLLGVAWLFRTNNDLTREQAAGATRLCMMSAILLSQVVTAEALLTRRRPWPWLRSLPGSSRQRVGEDLAMLGIPALAAVLGACLLDPVAALTGLCASPLLVVLAGLTLRHARGRTSGVVGLLMGAGAVLVAIVTRWPASAFVMLLSTVPLFLLTARSDRRLVVTAWDPLHNDAAGDSLSEVYR
ncbi:MAG: hypothetical protein KC729_15670 [Candidatus Eisenbacteria bacterium]|uniref:Uncharacterized protein n=1 Tax=Eiseniibacteriota bacterium TaxID=2212470 RepID=A0A956M198_UNCEI|nr:hypothetical protein [Candidatus Eisenbacteria bacterium]